MATDIKCPNCGHQFAMEEAVSEEYKNELREQMQTFLKSKEKEFQRKEQELLHHSQQQEAAFLRKLEEEKRLIQLNTEQSLRKSISTDYEIKLRMLEDANKDNEEKLKLSRQKELEFLKKEQELKTKEAEMELSVQRRMQEERSKLTEEIRHLEIQKTAARENDLLLKMKELEKQLDDQKKLAEEMKRKAEQGSMQLQGEVQELALEQLLRSSFPFDEISEVGKGIRGADCIMTVRNNYGQECGRIIYESKRTQSFSPEWIEKLKADMRNQGAHVAVIVTQTMPKDMECFGERNGVWICSFSEVRALSFVLRDGIIRVFNAAKSQENKGDKMQLLYNYLTSGEFSEQWKAIREGFLTMKQSIQKERDTMERLWKAREKQLEKVLLNAAHVRGSIEGIAGKDAIDVQLLEDDPDQDLLD
ncbi:DUF2130 domain-containing protein [Flavitalea sp. BT771]|uniref:DUF2130 domain-containing protein n=1 Tax=Flavitalea sp. BT771 TaxID=3063329 RepID=UPI0026E15330|nr:DUF2130 domain-containing protein [Flavitalea sp. BT771]MDO6431012.1 DUF2130 domain-containing protein [Flavitalea sp. BT771]MDV6219919.1 DUF2130 domain-containing protein [Flavitalea sp. BT771]